MNFTAHAHAWSRSQRTFCHTFLVLKLFYVWLFNVTITNNQCGKFCTCRFFTSENVISPTGQKAKHPTAIKICFHSKSACGISGLAIAQHLNRKCWTCKDFSSVCAHVVIQMRQLRKRLVTILALVSFFSPILAPVSFFSSVNEFVSDFDNNVLY